MRKQAYGQVLCTSRLHCIFNWSENPQTHGLIIFRPPRMRSINSRLTGNEVKKVTTLFCKLNVQNQRNLVALNTVLSNLISWLDIVSNLKLIDQAQQAECVASEQDLVKVFVL